jgi:nitrate/TMAO reductase-like tetraheme cytochrome c subunit
MHLTYVDISKLTKSDNEKGITPQRVKQIVERALSEEQIDKIKSERSVYKAIWAKVKNKNNTNEEMLEKTKQYANNRAKIFWECGKR